MPCNETNNWALSLKRSCVGLLRVDVGQVHAKGDVLLVAMNCRKWKHMGGKLRNPTSAGGC